MRWALAPLLVVVAGCVPAGREDRLAAPLPHFDPLTFFAGASHGDGRLRIVASGVSTVEVDSRGEVEPNGTLRLEQRVQRAGKAPTARVWHIRRVGPDRYAGTLSDAAGPVTGDVVGNRLHLAFAMKGTRAEQWLYLQPGGQVARNRMVVRKWGVPVASLDETIRRGG